MSSHTTIIKQFIDSLVDINNTSEHTKRIEQWAEQQESGLLYDLAQALHKPIAGIPDWAADSIRTNVVKALAITHGPTNAAAALRLAIAPFRIVHPRTIASWLASGQDLQTLVGLVEHFTNKAECDEVLLLIIQELVLRGTRCDQEPILLAHNERMREANHPLTWLPLYLIPSVEDGIWRWLPQYSLAFTGFSTPSSHHSVPSLEPSSNHVEFSATIITTDADRTRIGTCINNWVGQSNGHVDAGVFTLNPPAEPNQLSPTLLHTLETKALKDGTATIKTIALPMVFSNLFSATSSGGAYTMGNAGAQGRFEAWQSLAGLVGAPSDATIQEITSAAEKCNWMTVSSTSEWFYHIAWDIAILCLRPGGRELAFLAATDTD